MGGPDLTVRGVQLWWHVVYVLYEAGRGRERQGGEAALPLPPSASRLKAGGLITERPGCGQVQHTSPIVPQSEGEGVLGGRVARENPALRDTSWKILNLLPILEQNDL